MCETVFSWDQWAWNIKESLAFRSCLCLTDLFAFKCNQWVHWPPRFHLTAESHGVSCCWRAVCVFPVVCKSTTYNGKDWNFWRTALFVEAWQESFSTHEVIQSMHWFERGCYCYSGTHFLHLTIDNVLDSIQKHVYFFFIWNHDETLLSFSSWCFRMQIRPSEDVGSAAVTPSAVWLTAWIFMTLITICR